MLKLYNTLTRQYEEIPSPADDVFRLYTCGPTVYNHAHIGNMRSYVLADVLYRTLKYNGLKVKWVMNITDIEDKIIKATIKKFGPETGLPELKQFTDEYCQLFLQDLAALNVSAPEIEFIKVTDVIPQIQEFIISLIDKGYAYIAEDGSTYFHINKYQEDFGDYGLLVGEKFLEGKKVGVRVKVDEYDKDNLSDFALWKARDAADGNIFWDHPQLGPGRPGWHIECSVINNVAFGNTPTDLHTGGVDLIFPHHTNEIAQSQPFYKPFSRYWFHSEHLLVDNRRMAKSSQNFYTLSDLEKVVPNPGLALRYLFLQSHYKSSENFTFDSLRAANTALNKLYDFVRDNKANKNDGSANEKFLQAINNDLNTSQALAAAWEQKESLLQFDQVLGLKLDQPPQITIPAEVQELADQREQARLAKDFAKSDALRQKISDLGFEVEDTADGPKLKPK